MKSRQEVETIFLVFVIIQNSFTGNEKANTGQKVVSAIPVELNCEIRQTCVYYRFGNSSIYVPNCEFLHTVMCIRNKRCLL